MTTRTTVWVLGDQLNADIASLRDRRAKIGSKRWHPQRLHVVLSAMAHFAQELRDAGFEVDHRRAASFTAGLRDHRAEFEPDRVVAMAPMSWDGAELLHDLGVEVVPNDQFVCSAEQFAEWESGVKRTRLEDFYRWQRTRLGVLMDGAEPEGGRWNFDADNREPPPRDGRRWPGYPKLPLDALDRAVIERLPDDGWGAGPHGTWPVTRRQALERLELFVSDGLDGFGPHEDAMLFDEWKLAHSALSSSLNLGLLHPREVVAAAERAYRTGTVRLSSAEGFIRQVLGWREYVWGIYWSWMPGYRTVNELGARRPVPPAFTGQAATGMRCVSGVVDHLHDHAYAHHIERLMVLGNLALTAGVDPQAMTDWMWASFVDGAEWVMLPNVLGMALYADGGRMATKPYASGGAYINRMSDYCGDCQFDPKKRTGPDACPFTTLYWDFLDRNEEVLRDNHRISRQLGALRRLSDRPAVRSRAAEVLSLLDEGRL